MISKNKILHFSFSSPHRTDFPLVKQRQMIFFSVSLIYFCSLFFLNSLFLMLVIEIHDICLKMNCFHEIPIQLPVIALKVEIKRLTIHGRKRVIYSCKRRHTNKYLRTVSVCEKPLFNSHCNTLPFFSCFDSLLGSTNWMLFDWHFLNLGHHIASPGRADEAHLSRAPSHRSWKIRLGTEAHILP